MNFVALFGMTWLSFALLFQGINLAAQGLSSSAPQEGHYSSQEDQMTVTSPSLLM